jgi:hypothetical protein
MNLVEELCVGLAGTVFGKEFFLGKGGGVCFFVRGEIFEDLICFG